MKTLISTTIELEKGDDLVLLDIDGIVHYTIDRDYGSDADGRRGTIKTFIDDIVDVMATDSEGETFELNKEQLEKVERKITEKFMHGDWWCD